MDKMKKQNIKKENCKNTREEKGIEKMLKKFFIVFSTIIIILGLCSNVNAANANTSLNIIQKASEKKYLENDQGFVEKEIINSNSQNGEVSIQLKLSNESKESQETSFDSTEVVFVIDNSLSMEEKVNETQTRRDVVIAAAKDFTSQLFKDVSNLKVGLTYYYAWDSDDEGKTPKQSYGTMDTAKILSNLTDNETKIQDALTSLASMNYSYGTNTDAGIQRAKSMFSNSKTAQKFIILLSDGVPNYAVGVSVYTGGLLYPSEEEQKQSVITKTKATLQSINNSNINLITMLTGLGELTDDDKTMIESIFGTTSNPTVGALYNISDTDISTIVKEKIYKDVIEKVNSAINKVKIVDYFPKDITDNFDFSYVGKPSIGTVPDSIDTKDKTITWDIGTLKGSEVATLVYKLKLKDMSNTTLLNKTIATNEKVVLTYQDSDSKDYTVTLTSSPKIQLAEVNTKTNDPTVAKTILPNAGSKIVIAVTILVVIVSGAILFGKYKSYKDI